MPTRLASACLLVLVPAVAAATGCGGGSGGGGGGGGGPVPILYDVFHDELAAYGEVTDGHVPGLVTFDLEYLNGDHHAWSLSAGGVLAPTAPDPDTFRLELHDGDNGPFGDEADDPVSMLARYYDLSSISARHVVTGFDLQGVARLPLEPALDEGELFVLSGFSVRTDGSNHHLQILRVEAFPLLGYVEVEYADESPGDDLYSATVAYAIVPEAHRTGSDLRPVFDGPFESTFDFAGRTTTAPRRGGYPVLQGFSLRYRKGDRHLERVAVDLGWPDVIHGTLQDGDPSVDDDVVDATVQYLLMTP